MPPSSVIFCDTQTAGRGRQGKSWVGKPGNLFTTICLENTFNQPVSHLSFVTGLAIFDVINLYSTQTPVLKWPNDVLVDRKKISGILIEVENDNILIGIGINIAHAPDGLDQETICLNDLTSSSLDLDTILLKLLERFDHYINLWQKSGFKAIRDLWSNHALSQGTTLMVSLENTRKTGSYEGISEDGSLLFKLDQEIIKISAADVWI